MYLGQFHDIRILRGIMKPITVTISIAIFRNPFISINLEWYSFGIIFYEIVFLIKHFLGHRKPLWKETFIFLLWTSLRQWKNRFGYDKYSDDRGKFVPPIQSTYLLPLFASFRDSGNMLFQIWLLNETGFGYLWLIFRDKDKENLNWWVFGDIWYLNILFIFCSYYSCLDL